MSNTLSDELLARKLQEQFDEEESEMQRKTNEDKALAREMSFTHTSSDSEDEVQIVSSPKSASKEIPNKEENNEKTPCKYGSSCYRKNPQHFAEFSHPSDKRKCDNNVTETPPLKKKKSVQKCNSTPSTSRKANESNAKLPFEERLRKSQPYNIFLNKVYSVKETHGDARGLVLPDLLNPKLGTIVESMQINYMVDLDYVKKSYDVFGLSDKPVLIVYGELEGPPSIYPKAVCCKVNMPFLYGVHHSKVMVFQYKEGLRVVIHTANLRSDDWEEKTQGYWVSPLFPPLEKPTLLEGESDTSFKKDFVDYLLSYKLPDVTRWVHIVKSYDFSQCRAVFIGSVPGYHTGETIAKYGHRKLRSCLRKYSNTVSNPGTLIVQCSSIGSLGKEAKTWLSSEFAASLNGGAVSSKINMKVIYPSEDDVRKSSQGYGGGSCLPYNSQTHAKQEWLMNYLCNWRCSVRKRSRAMPHIKSYTKWRGESIQYYLLTSSNLSKAAWGIEQKNSSQLFIRSYEAGVLLLPRYINKEEEEFSLSDFPLHYDVPLNPYENGVKPWLMDTKKTTLDINGNSYP